MIGVTAKIGEFFSSLILALLTVGAKVLVVGVVVLALVGGLLFGLRYLRGRRDRDRSS